MAMPSGAPSARARQLSSLACSARSASRVHVRSTANTVARCGPPGSTAAVIMRLSCVPSACCTDRSNGGQRPSGDCSSAAARSASQFTQPASTSAVVTPSRRRNSAFPCSIRPSASAQAWPIGLASNTVRRSASRSAKSAATCRSSSARRRIAASAATKLRRSDSNSAIAVEPGGSAAVPSAPLLPAATARAHSSRRRSGCTRP